jgi:hypothetical protein
MHIIHAAAASAPAPIDIQQEQQSFRTGAAPLPRARTHLHRPAGLTLQMPRQQPAIAHADFGSPTRLAPHAPSSPAPSSPADSPQSAISLPFPFLRPDCLLNGLDADMRLIVNDVMRDDSIYGRAAPGTSVGTSMSPPEPPSDTDSPPAIPRGAATPTGAPLMAAGADASGKAPRRPGIDAWRRSLMSTLQMGPRRDITRDVVLEASQRLREPFGDIRSFARRQRVSLQALRSFVDGYGRLTDLGRAVTQGTLLTPGDRRAANLPDIDRKTTLSEEDFALADRRIKVTAGGLSRSLFSDLYGYDRATIVHAYREDGSLTDWGRAQRAEAARHARMAAAAPAGPHGDSTMPAAPAGTDVEGRAQRLAALAEGEGIAIAYWHDGSFRKLGRSDAPLAGNVDRTGPYWRICPSRGGDFRLMDGERAMEHVINILRLEARGHIGHTAVVKLYALTRADARGPYLAVPGPDALSTTAPAARKPSPMPVSARRNTRHAAGNARRDP